MTSEPESGWQQRRALAATVRVAATLVPVAASVAVGVLANVQLAVATTVPGAVLRAVGIMALSLPVLVGVDALARRFLPLTVLLQLSLVFPDQTPSRFKLALKAGSGRRMAKAVGEAKANGLSEVPSEAAEQLVLLATAIGDHDRRTRGHSERVRLYAELIGEGLGLSAAERAKLQWAALIHDIGKITVPPAILNKKGKPDAEEWAILQGHPAAGEAFVAPLEGWLGEWTHAVGGHHEKWDGSGYPRGLVGADIPRSAAIVAVADSFEVMTAVRSYKKAMSLADARREMTRCAGSHFSPEVVRGFLNLSIGDLRRSMGVLAGLAHVPVLGRLTTAASYAPDTISTAVSATTSVASVGAGAVAVTAAVTVGAPGMAEAPPASPTPVVAAPASFVLDAAPASGEMTIVLPAVVPERAPAVAESVAEEPEAEREVAAAAPRRTRTAVVRPRPSTPVADAAVPAAVTPASGGDDVVAAPESAASVAEVVADEPGPVASETPAASASAGRAEPPAAPPSAAEHRTGHANANGQGNGSPGNGNAGGNATAPEPAPTPAPAPGSGTGNGDVGGNGNAGGNPASDNAGGNDSPGNGSAGGNGNGRGRSEA